MVRACVFTDWYLVAGGGGVDQMISMRQLGGREPNGGTWSHGGRRRRRPRRKRETKEFEL